MALETRPPWWERTLHWPRFFAKKDADPAMLYNLRGTDAVCSGGSVPLVNMGLWDGIHPAEPESLERAVYALFDLVAQGAALGPEDRVLDVGCGFGTNAIHCARNYGVKQITGINISAVQLATARERLAVAGLESRVNFQEASATALPMEEGSVDKVVSVEAAFHFDPRERFLAESFRVLRPGGLLSVVDLVIPPAGTLWQRPALEAVCRSQAVPRSNLYGSDDYLRKIREAGFEVLESESIHHRVFPHFRRWQLTRPPRLLLGYDLMFIAVSLPYLVYPFDYLRVVARRP